MSSNEGEKSVIAAIIEYSFSMGLKNVKLECAKPISGCIDNRIMNLADLLIAKDAIATTASNSFQDYIAKNPKLSTVPGDSAPKLDKLNTDLNTIITEAKSGKPLKTINKLHKIKADLVTTMKEHHTAALKSLDDAFAGYAKAAASPVATGEQKKLQKDMQQALQTKHDKEIKDIETAINKDLYNLYIENAREALRIFLLAQFSEKVANAAGAVASIGNQESGKFQGKNLDSEVIKKASSKLGKIDIYGSVALRFAGSRATPRISDIDERFRKELLLASQIQFVDKGAISFTFDCPGISINLNDTDRIDSTNIGQKQFADALAREAVLAAIRSGIYDEHNPEESLAKINVVINRETYFGSNVKKGKKGKEDKPMLEQLNTLFPGEFQTRLEKAKKASTRFKASVLGLTTGGNTNTPAYKDVCTARREEFKKQQEEKNRNSNKQSTPSQAATHA